ncbi:hypothetical protein SAMN05421541_107232 [Actinoplanes philippinensis]|uniref:Transglutaminase-like superfamily protein n=1 Tax=Actinoplanes philippinensis TaxID=35752 RepID=A0A1I2GUK8_9ACTN|nr:hypothetical protein [Actinoplanes philippinensis]SFF21624.1 hypothetical protein SAMN05421541_107232 [Actinoplanes philippinensis]
MLRRHLDAGPLTTLGPHARSFAAIPPRIESIAPVVRGLFLLEERAATLGIPLTETDRRTVHLRSAGDMLDAVTARDARPLSEPRPPGRRVVTTARGFATVAAAVLRARGVPARVRCGFATYLIAGRYEEHWLVEYHERRLGRWLLADVQLDEEQRPALPLLLPALDVPRGRAWVGGQNAWIAIRHGHDPARYGSHLTAARADPASTGTTGDTAPPGEAGYAEVAREAGNAPVAAGRRNAGEPGHAETAGGAGKGEVAGEEGKADVAGGAGSRADAVAGESVVAAVVLRDIACLDDAICLPWDRWAPMPEPGEPVDRERFDAIAMGGEHVHPPEQVYNARRGRTETFVGRPPIH